MVPGSAATTAKAAEFVSQTHGRKTLFVGGKSRWGCFVLETEFQDSKGIKMKRVMPEELEDDIGDVIAIVHKEDLAKLLQKNLQAAEGKALYIIVPEAEEDKSWSDTNSKIPHVKTEVILEKGGR